MSHRRSIDRRVPEDWSLPYRERTEKRQREEKEAAAERRAYRGLMTAAASGDVKARAYLTATANVKRARTVTHGDGAAYDIDRDGTYRRASWDEKYGRLVSRRLRKLGNGMKRFGEAVDGAAKATKEFFDTVNGLATKGGE